mmetsp:Transcript_40393/g.77504  ORF Transcript_40393/g.77504 Transcript_40393/m.77504 type:complete len:113 (+) Transcript_40393:665-1003(+)|eukprot:CAMPEP_0172668260 /NCGR_PEP_ID=MMETSP1074-20121228/8953_1 /TAXON_ID=2916 /ORGANISM="Ceratium fusus, Strain PA161109" /LENGTH=112 /DNA_ID=CAMNT_0013484891 /DNA_START=594 /DNA_END=932 /DNA_ORIENTATION=+
MHCLLLSDANDENPSVALRAQLAPLGEPFRGELTPASLSAEFAVPEVRPGEDCPDSRLGENVPEFRLGEDCPDSWLGEYAPEARWNPTPNSVRRIVLSAVRRGDSRGDPMGD